MLATIAIAVAQMVMQAPQVYDPIKVEGHGQTFEQAKESAFRQAIETNVGVLILGERETKNYQLVKNDIYAHSAGYVKEFKILDVKQHDGVYDVTVEVTVASSKLKNRILSKGESTAEFPGEQIDAQISTFNHSKEQADDLLKHIMSKYPQEAYTITNVSSEVKVDSSRKAKLAISFTLQWNKGYLEELTETLNAIQDSGKRDSYTGKVTIVNKRESDLILGSINKFYFADSIPLSIMNMHINTHDIRVRIDLKNNDTVLSHVCKSPDSFLNINTQESTIYGNSHVDYITELPEQTLANVNNIVLSVDDATHCRK